MSYTPTEWQNGDTVTAEKLNKLEQGVADAGGGGSGILIVHDTEGTLDKTYAEIKAAFVAVIVTSTNRLWYPVRYFEESVYALTVMGEGEGGGLTVNDYLANSADDYPVLD